MTLLRPITTKDSSITFHSDRYDETYHSVSGAKEEAIKKFAEPCGIAGYNRVAVLDICFGLGYNSAAALDLFRGDHIEIVALEDDPGIIDQIKHISVDFSSYPVIKTLAKDRVFKDSRADLRLLIDDARQAIKSLPSDHFDVIFLDPFSPKKCPELWTEGFFKEIFRVCKKESMLATYSCARVVRDNLRSAGFIVTDGPVVGRKAPGTLAIKQ
ncbi:TPA: hypothetical protein HA265_00305 [Candidatus Woesearchaeota archaeon]|nr:hypothetical protein [Candidatus Woesearchaeota archaeon]